MTVQSKFYSKVVFCFTGVNDLLHNVTEAAVLVCLCVCVCLHLHVAFHQCWCYCLYIVCAFTCVCFLGRHQVSHNKTLKTSCTKSDLYLALFTHPTLHHQALPARETTPQLHPPSKTTPPLSEFLYTALLPLLSYGVQPSNSAPTLKTSPSFPHPKNPFSVYLWVYAVLPTFSRGCAALPTIRVVFSNF